MSDEDLQVEAIALEYVKSHKKELIERFCPPSICHSIANPVSLFMAGSPGAGKTEVSKGLIKKFNDVPVRIDADEIRAFLSGLYWY
jgi:UDP-N-acetylglucosamine kinase